MNLETYQAFVDIELSPISINEKKLKLTRLFQYILDESLINERIHFTSLFSKIAYLGVRYELQGNFLFELHNLRKRIENPSEHEIDLDHQILAYLIPKLHSYITQSNIPQNVLEIMPNHSGIEYTVSEIKNYLPHVKYLCISVDKKQKVLKGFSEENPQEIVFVDYNIQDRNDRFLSGIESIPLASFPILIELIEVECNLEGMYRPSGFVIEPDFLVDVTSIAGCFDHKGTKTINYILRKFLPMSWSKALLLGNIANYFLDQLVENTQVTFDELLKQIFQLDPLAFARIPDNEIPTFVKDMKKHFYNIKKSLISEFPKEKIDLENSYLEPSFLSSIYGLQGRLDLLHMDEEYTSIIELKSGSIYKPNTYGLKNDHYTQTLLYDLLIRSTFDFKKPRNYILYSKESQKTLRIAPRIAAQQKEALKVRNDLIHIEHALNNEAELIPLLRQINTHFYADVKGFEATNIQNFDAVYSALDELELDYFHSFIQFISIEHRLAKIGEYGQDKSNGLAGLWLDSYEEKYEQFNMIYSLEMHDIKAGEKTPTIQLKYTDKTNKLSNFREGDIALLYPLNDGSNSPLKNQIFKCTVLNMTQDTVTIQLRSPQNNLTIFQENPLWNIEHDVMDTSFTNMYRQLYEWARGPKKKRKQLLTLEAPGIREHSDQNAFSGYDDLSAEQNSILKGMVNADDYYLVWGPPGTGKTSRIIRQYIKHIMDNTQENLYILAYTNRAVDELCACIQELGKEYEEMYIRIGSKFGAKEEYRDKLLSSKIQGITKRKELISGIKKHRMVVGTIASMASKEMIYDLIKPTKVIIDESSQILEPYIIGLLTRFEKFILVGDHKQLPAVVVQSEQDSIVTKDSLKNIGLHDRRDSLFERLYKRCLENNWTHAIGQLQYQGRMHSDIMKFPNEQFYNETLHVLPDIERLSYSMEKNENNLVDSARVIFEQVDIPPEEKYSKTNSAEVKAVIHAILRFINQGYPIHEIGVITPFRAQIAAIHEAVQNLSIDTTGLTIDTVERFQGGARQVIIISFCCNSPVQFRSMVSISTEGIDRKLNVALTRAKEKLMLIGDENILRKNPLYDELISGAFSI